MRTWLLALPIVLAATYSAAGADCRRITFVHPYGPGSTSASVLRMLAEELQGRLGVPVVVDYRPGQRGVPSASALLGASPDGCTIGVLAGIHSSSPWLMENPPYDPTREFVPITLIGQFPNVLVTADPRMRTFRDFLRIAKAAPGSVNVATMSAGSPDYITGLLLQEAGIPVNLIPYEREAAQMLVDVLNGSVHVGIQNYFTFSGALEQGGIWALAVTTKERLAKLPDVPSVFEEGLPNFTETKSWFGFWGPPNLPPDDVRRLNREVTAILRKPEFVQKMNELGVQAKPSTPDELAKLMADEYRLQGDVIKRFKTRQ